MTVDQSISPERAAELADKLESARVKAGWEPLRSYHQRGNRLTINEN